MQNSTAQTKNWWLQYAALAICPLLLLWPAFYNGYPMVNADAATYLASGFIPETPFDRPITYGLLIRLFSLNGLSLWTVVYAQALLIACMITAIIKHFVNGSYYVYSALAIFLLSACTGLPWLVSQIQPDVFTPIAILCIAIFFMGGESKAERVWLYVLFTISVAVHMSHPVIMAGTVLCTYLLQKVVAPQVKRMHLRPLSLFILSFACIGVMGAALSKSKHVFLMGSLVEKGILKKYLDDQCVTTSYKICAYKNDLPATLNEFIWVNTSPLYKVGDWSGSKPEFNAIIGNILTTPKYLFPFLGASASTICTQLVTFGMGDGNTAFLPASSLSQRIARYIPREAAQFQSSRQNRETLLPVFIVPGYISFWLTALAILVLGIYYSRMPYHFRLFMLVCAIGILLNAADTATFGCVQARYGCRVMWLMSFCAICCVIINRRNRQGIHT